MLVIRLFRTGKKNQPSFKIVVTDKRKSSTKGVYVEEVGFWNPLTKEKVLKQERVKYWLSVGAKPSATVHNLLISEKIIEGKKIPVHKKAKEVEEEKPVAEASPHLPPSSAKPSSVIEAPAVPEKPAETPPVEKKEEEKPAPASVEAPPEKPAEKSPPAEKPKTE